MSKSGKSRRGKATVVPASTRTRAKNTAAQAPKGAELVDVPKRKGGRPRLDEGKALAAIAAGKPAATVARLAGSQATDREILGGIGRRLIRRLRETGQIREVFDAVNVTLEAFALNVKARMEATRIVEHTFAGAVFARREEPDYATQAEACREYMEVCGLRRLELDVDVPEDEGPLSELTDAELANLLSLAREPQPASG